MTSAAAALLQLSLGSQLGTSTSPLFTTAFPEVRGYGAVVELEGKVRLSPRVDVGSRVALALMRVQQPAGALYGEAAWANPELSVGFEQVLVAAERWTLRLAPRLALGLPLAEHGSRASQLEGRALVLADAFEGFAQPELFTPGIVALTPSARIELGHGPWRFEVKLKLPLLLRVSDASLPEDSAARAFGVVPVLDWGAWAQPWRWLTLGLAPRLTWRARAPVDDRRGALQPLVAASAGLHLPRGLDAAFMLQAPVAGPLGGGTIAGGLRLSACF